MTAKLKKISIALAALLFLRPAFSFAGPVASGVEALRKNRYEEAVVLFASAPEDVRKNALADLNFGMALSESAKLYKDLYGLSIRLHADYLERVASVKGSERSRYARLYLGRTLLEAGNPREAAADLERFLAEKGVSENYRQAALAGLGLAYHRIGAGKKALAAWGKVNSTDPMVLTELARAYASASREGEAVILADRAFAAIKASKKRPGGIVTANLLGVYASRGLVDKGFEALRLSGTSDLGGYSYEERISEYKSIRFYDTRLLSDLSAFYGAAAIRSLKESSGDDKLKGIAGFYLAETYALMNDVTSSEAARTASTGLPARLNYRAELLAVENLYRAGGKDAAIRRLKNCSGGPDALTAEALSTCVTLGVRCGELASKAESGGAKRPAAFNQALGRYFLFEKDPAKALRYMEEGRDKANKNKVEFNPPRALTALAEAYWAAKQYPEALEIFFGMNRHFPATRQLQMVLQGIYSMEQKSAGDVKIL